MMKCFKNLDPFGLMCLTICSVCNAMASLGELKCFSFVIVCLVLLVSFLNRGSPPFFLLISGIVLPVV
jgi:hypothetical protein